MDLFEDECERRKCLSGYRQSPAAFSRHFVPDKYFLETALGLIEEIKYKEMNHKDAGYVYEGPTWEEAVLEGEDRAKVVVLGSRTLSIIRGDGHRTFPPGVWGHNAPDDQDRCAQSLISRKKGTSSVLRNHPLGMSMLISSSQHTSQTLGIHVSW